MATAPDNKRSIDALERKNIMNDIKIAAIQKSQKIILASLEKAGIEVLTLEDIEPPAPAPEEAPEPPKEEAPKEPPASKYEDVDVDDLRAEATARELKFHPSTGKVKLIALLEKDDMTKTTDSNEGDDNAAKDNEAF